MIDLSRISYKSLLGKVLRLPLKAIPGDTVLSVLQGPLRGKKWIAGAGNHGYWLGTYELAKRRVFESAVKNGSVVFDIGAHAGYYTLLASMLVGDRGQVSAFEPSQRNLFYLEEHLRLNGVTNATVIESAVSDIGGEVSFVQEQGNTFTGRISPSGRARITSVTLDGLVQKERVSVPDYMKIDVEGAEMRVLLGAIDILKKHHPTLFLSTHGSDVHKECCDLLNSLGYQLRPLDGENLERSEELLAFCNNQCQSDSPLDRRL